MSHKTEIYGNYLRKWETDHADMVKPEIITDNPTCREMFQSVPKTGQIISASRKVFTWNYDGNIYLMPDGRVIELVQQTEVQFFWPKAAVWPTYKAWLDYDTPMSPNAYWENF